MTHMVKGGNLITKKIFALAAFLLAFIVLASSAYAGTSAGSYSSSSFDVSIDRVRINGNSIAQSRSNLIQDANVFTVVVDFTAVQTLEKGRVEAILRGRQTGSTIADSTAGTINLPRNSSSTATLSLALIDNLRRETDFDLTIKIADARGRSEQKSFGIRTEAVARARGVLDVSIDRVQVNNKAVAQSKANFIDETDDFDVLVEFTALEDLEDAHVEAILRDLRTGFVVADATQNFDLGEDLSSSRLLRLSLLNDLKKSDSFELTVKIVDAEGDSVQKTFGLRMEDGRINGLGRILDISIDSVEVERKVIAENENNFVVLDNGKNDLDVRVRLTSLENIDNARVDAVLTLENGDVVADTTTTFSIREDERTLKRLDLPLIGRFAQRNFKLKIKVIDAEGDFEEKLYGLKISQDEFPLVISGISLIAENVEAGKHLIARLSFRDVGVVPLEGVTAKVSIPELGISATKFLEQKNGAGMSQEFTLKIPGSASTGTYTLRAEVSSQFDVKAEIKEIPIFITGREAQIKQVVNDKLVINVPIAKQNVFHDSEVIYPITLTNLGPGANSYTLLLDGADWANLRLSESNVILLKPKDSKTINVYASSKGRAKGEQAFLVTIKSDDKVLKEIPLIGNAISAKGLSPVLKNALQITLISLVILLAAFGLFAGARKYMQKGDEKEEIMQETYY